MSEAFAKALQSQDLDPIYVCSELRACPKNSCLQGGCTSIANVVVSPSSGPIGTIFNVSVTVIARNNTGTGTTVLAWKCPTTGETGESVLNEGLRAGTTTQVKANSRYSSMV